MKNPKKLSELLYAIDEINQTLSATTKTLSKNAEVMRFLAYQLMNDKSYNEYNQKEKKSIKKTSSKPIFDINNEDFEEIVNQKNKEITPKVNKKTIKDPFGDEAEMITFDFPENMPLEERQKFIAEYMENIFDQNHNNDDDNEFLY